MMGFVDIVSGRVGLFTPSLVVPGTLHDDQPREVVEEDDPHPSRHAMSSRCTEVPVDDDDGDENGDDVHHEGEEEVLSDQRNSNGRRRKDLRYEDHEDDQRQQNRYAHRHLFDGIGG